MRGRWAVTLLAVCFHGGLALQTVSGSVLEEEELWKQGQKELASGDAEQARERFEKLLGRYPENSELQLMLGLSALKARDVSAVETHLSRALELAPENSEALTLLGWFQLEVEGEPVKAVQTYERVVAIEPEVAEAHNNLGVALQRMGELDRAVASFSNAIELKPDYVEALSNRGWAGLNRNDTEAAERDFRSSLALDPDDQGALYGLARVLKMNRDYAGAQEALARLGSESPNFVYWLEWATVGAVRYYWVFLLFALGVFFYYRYKRKRGVISNG